MNNNEHPMSSEMEEYVRWNSSFVPINDREKKMIATIRPIPPVVTIGERKIVEFDRHGYRKSHKRMMQRPSPTDDRIIGSPEAIAITKRLIDMHGANAIAIQTIIGAAREKVRSPGERMIQRRIDEVCGMLQMLEIPFF